MRNGNQKIAFVTYAGLPGLAADDRLAVAELESRGAEVSPAVWDDPGVQWSGYDGVVLRSCWDYHLRPAEFEGWLARLEGEGVPLWNPARVVRGNLDKGYLVELGKAGIPVVPTVRVEKGAAASLARLLEEKGWDEVVVKPAISASAFKTWRTSRDKAGAEPSQFDELLSGSGALIQPFLPEIQTNGEWSVIFLGGEYSHAVRKLPKEGDFRVQNELGGSARPETPGPEVLERARAIVAAIPGPWLYARVDGVETSEGFLLMELELTEPSLFLGTHPPAPARFAEAILALAP